MERGKREGSVCYSDDVGECCCQFTEKPPGSQVLLHQWSRQDKLFLLFAFPVLPLDQRMGQCFESAARSNPLS